jgi:hypothetical protein
LLAVQKVQPSFAEGHFRIQLPKHRWQRTLLTLEVAVVAQVPKHHSFQVGHSYSFQTYGQALVGIAWYIQKACHVPKNFLQRIAWRELDHVQWPELMKNFREVGEAKRIPQ